MKLHGRRLNHADTHALLLNPFILLRYIQSFYHFGMGKIAFNDWKYSINMLLKILPIHQF